jgi:hypothetical protein
MSVYVGIDVHRKRSQVAVIDQDGKVLANRNVNNGVKLEAGGAGTTLSGPSRIRGPLGPLYFPSVVTLSLPNLIELHFQLGNLCRPGVHRAGSYVPDADPGGLGSLTSQNSSWPPGLRK